MCLIDVFLPSLLVRTSGTVFMVNIAPQYTVLSNVTFFLATYYVRPSKYYVKIESSRNIYLQLSVLSHSILYPKHKYSL